MTIRNSLRHGTVALLVNLLAMSGAGRVGAFELTSSAFERGETIPAKHTCDGADLSPPLAWTDPPPNTKSLALVCDDPDAPAGTWVHWVLYDLPPTARQLPAGVPATPAVAGGGHQGVNDFKRSGYGGPCPPRGAPHRYSFRLYALDAPLGLTPGATKAVVLRAAEGHTLAQAELVGRYGRE
jgi:Raf kinase inhibitor-like YbhB/YbcL family protein